jgi:putative transcriptional regulator
MHRKANLIKAERNAMKRLVPALVARYARKNMGKSDMTTKKTSKSAVKKTTRAPKPQTVGESIIQGLKEAIAWNKGENDNVRVTLVHVPKVDVRKVRLKMGLSQAQFATKFGFPPATLRNWEQGRSHPDAPTRVLLAVIAKHPEAVEDVLRKAG